MLLPDEKETHNLNVQTRKLIIVFSNNIQISLNLIFTAVMNY